ncbi:hypothetical protein DYL59_21305 [Pseudomonas kairouanensis]|uniref:Condensation domain-containing protein n=1 Tax=Pseudomonas kairouanensis TaxID=2293832 RepID=A0A4Z0AKC5_9PSED|nr:hypothetical protein [Pseudomonas kairouanensis]TFY86694.1 hypothetical protein DYL59_21305 [Pseudomonas kairouanensis]
MQAHHLLDETEQRFHQNFLHRDGNTQVTSLLTIPGGVSPLQAMKAFEQLIADYPFLAQKIVAVDESRYGFVPVDNPVHLSPSAMPASLRADALIKLELNRLLGNEEGWRAWVVPDALLGRTHILLTRNHAISDGYSTARLVSSLAGYLGAAPPYADSESPGAFHLRLACWGESPLDTGKPSHADFVRLRVTQQAVQRINQLRETSGFTANAIWGGVFAFSYLKHARVPAFDLFTAYSLRDPSQHDQPLTKACLIDVRHTTLTDDAPDVLGSIERYARVVTQDRAQLGVRPTPSGGIAAQAARPALAFTNTGVLDRFLTHPQQRVLGFSTVVNRSGGNYDFVLHLGKFNGTWHAALAFSSLKVDVASALAFKAQIEHTLDALPAPRTLH